MLTNAVRLAWFSPLPPTRSGIAAYSAELLPLLRREYLIDCFTGTSADQFVWKHLRHRYDLIVYQLGNASCHDYMWGYLTRYPGLVVLHDAQLHQARARDLLAARREDDYRREFAYSHPDAPPAVAELVVAGRGGSHYFFWPMLRVPIQTARLAAVHSATVARELMERFSGASIETISMGVADTKGGGRQSAGGSQQVAGGSRQQEEPGDIAASSGLRARHGIPAEAIVFAAFGNVTPEKRIPQAIRAFARIAPREPGAHLLLVGETATYFDAPGEARRLGVADRVSVTGFVDGADLAAYIRAADVCLCLRWPTSRETSASWLRCLAAGKPTVITQLVHTADVPASDPRSWTGLEAIGSRPAAISVSIDLLDEEHSLEVAMRRLAGDAELRETLGGRARAYWLGRHTLDRMADDYRRVIDLALGRVAPTVADLPQHLREDGTALVRQIAIECGLAIDPLGLPPRAR